VSGLLWWLWGGLPWYVQWAIMAAPVLLLVGLAMNLSKLASLVAGKWGVGAVVAVFASIGIWIASKFVRRGVDDFVGEVTGRDAEPSPRRPKVLVGRTAKRSGKRKYNPDTNEWE
jgi:hypothetical protein